VTAAVEIRDLFRIYSTPEGDAAALQGLSLSVQEGEIVAVLGPSGSGKTTLLRILAGFERPSAGAVRVFGSSLPTARSGELAHYRATHLGYLDQHYDRALDPALTARDLVAMRLHAHGIPAATRHSRADELLEVVGLGDRGSSRPGELSGGEQQRVALCAAVAHRPKLLLADEPTGELDAANADLVYAAVRDLAGAIGSTALIVSHDPAAATIADRSIRIRDGRVSEESTRAHGGDELVVIGRGGWLRVPEELLESAGIGSRAFARYEDGRVVIVPPEPRSGDGAAPMRAPRRSAPGDARTVAELEDLRKTYGHGRTARTVLDGISASFESGRLHVVTGPSGSGKTTLLHLLAGLLVPDSGDIRILGKSLVGLSRTERADIRRRHITIVTQQVGLIPFLSARENVELGLAIRGRAPVDGAGPASPHLALLGLADRSGQWAGRLSAGEQVRVALARSLAAEPELLLVDEPTARLDEANARLVAAMLVEVARERGTGVVCATHDPVLIDQADAELELDATAGTAGRARGSRSGTCR
jgi:ABC-type lipoprotein export system ATPase subunit